MPDTEPSVEQPCAAADSPNRPRRDSISPIAVLALLVFVTLQSSFVTFPSIFKHKSSIAGRGGAVSDAMPSRVENGILSIDIEAKASYVAIAKSPSSPQAASKHPKQRLFASVGRALSRSSAGERQVALDDAIGLFRKYPDQPALARRVILLRAETGSPDPLGPITVTSRRASGKTRVVFPLDAYRALLNASPPMAARTAMEEATWQALFGSQSPISRDQAIVLAARVRSMENLRWWTNIALHQLYLRAGEPGLASRSLVVADAEAERSVVLSELLNLIACACILIGILALATLLVRSVFAKRSSTESGSAQQSAASSHADAIGLSIFREMPPRIRDVDRRLGAGDLANLFALYLILMMGVQFIAPLVLRGPLGRYATSASAGAQTAFIIFAEAIVTAFCGCTTVAALFWLAKRRGASVADEIGLNAGAETLTKTVLFGILGWCISLPLVLGTADMASLIFHNAPSPANPAIPLLMATPGGLASIVLYILVAVLAPFFEETVFRGLFYNAARLRVGVWPAIALTGIAFGASHPVGIAEQVPLIVLGATLAWIAQTSKSLLPGMVLHCLQNSFVYALMFFTLLTIVGATPVLQ